MSKELFNYLFDSNDNVHLDSNSISFKNDLPQIPAPICSHLCIRHRLLRLNYHIASPNQSQIALCKKHIHKHSYLNNQEKLFSISNKNHVSISNNNHYGINKDIYQSIFNQLYLQRSSSSILVNIGSDRRT